MSTPELSEVGAATSEPAAVQAETQMAEANQRAAGFMFGALVGLGHFGFRPAPRLAQVSPRPLGKL